MCLSENFNPRPPRGGRLIHIVTDTQAETFQSTPPARGATLLRFRIAFSPFYFNPRPPRGGRPSVSGSYPSIGHQISIHAPREGGDRPFAPHNASDEAFQSTPPARGATDFENINNIPQNQFQSTPPARGATPWTEPSGFRTAFQSTPPARGATTVAYGRGRMVVNFNPRPPRGGRHKDITYKCTP